MAFCAFKVRSPGVLAVPGQFQMVDQGINVFNAEIPNIETFKEQLRDIGIEVLEVYRLDEYDLIEPVCLESPTGKTPLLEEEDIFRWR